MKTTSTTTVGIGGRLSGYPGGRLGLGRSGLGRTDDGPAIDIARRRRGHDRAHPTDGLCLTIAGGSKALNAIAVQYKCDGDVSREWTLAGDPNGIFLLVNAKSGLCLTVAGASTALNATAVQYYCDDDWSRQWF